MKNIFQKGLTLIEMLVVVSITVIFSAMVFGNYGTGKEGLAIERAGQKLQQDLRKTQEIAMSGSLGTGVNAVGIYFDEATPTTYIIYNNTNANYYYENGVDTIRETVNIESGVKICNTATNSGIIDYYDGWPGYPTSRSVSFSPPEPVTRIHDDNTLRSLSIVLCVTNNNSKIRSVNINTTGRISVGTGSSSSHEMIANGGFETGDFSGWTTTNSPTIVSNRYSGLYSVWLGGGATISQSVNLTDVDEIVFRVWYCEGGERFTIDGNLVYEFSSEHDWEEVVIDTSSYSGTHTIKFDGMGYGDLSVDDISAIKE